MLEKAIDEYRRIKSNGAKRRQAQFLGRLLREHAELDALEARFEHLLNSKAAGTYEHHQLERWRARLLAEKSALTEFINDYPGTDRQQLRQLVSKARQSATKEPEGETARASARALFRFLRDSVQPDPSQS